MREIKFRALGRDGVWVYFDFANGQRWAKKLLQKMAETDITFDFDTPFLQYTGLKDRNGKEIYEGDVLEGITGKYAVFWDKDACQFRIWGDRIIGNILENPEL